MKVADCWSALRNAGIGFRGGNRVCKPVQWRHKAFLPCLRGYVRGSWGITEQYGSQTIEESQDEARRSRIGVGMRSVL